MQINNLKKTVGGNLILDDITFSVNDSEKIGLVGANGAGKSTLLKILAGIIPSDSGTIKYNGMSVGYLKQEISQKFYESTILEYIKCELGLDILEKRLIYLEEHLNDSNMDEYGEVLDKFLALDGYNFENNLKMFLNGLAFKESITKRIKELSGGEKIKILIVTLLLENPDILLLDEPTNNLDLEAIEWLENYFNSTDKTIILVSHDEVFLNSIANKIFELRDGKISIYNLKYNAYLEAKELEYEQLKEDYMRATLTVVRLKKRQQKAKEWSAKGVGATKAKDNDKIAANFQKEQTNSSNISGIQKAIDKIDIPDFEEKKSIGVFFKMADEKGNADISIENLVCGYDDFRTPCINLPIRFGTTINVVGGNGSGKTTFIKTILGLIKPISGEVKVGSAVRFGYISQDTLIGEDNKTVLDFLTNSTDIENSSVMFTLLSKFNIPYEDRNKLYCLLSPGERTRVNLAKIALDKINVLILDEVTNHLDKEALDLIYELVESFKGTIISISHNRKYNSMLNIDITLDIRTGIFVYETKKHIK